MFNYNCFQELELFFPSSGGRGPVNSAKFTNCTCCIIKPHAVNEGKQCRWRRKECVSIVSMIIPVPSFWENETAWAQDVFHSTCKACRICCLSYIFTISAFHFHEEWVGHVLSMQIFVHFGIRRERQKREGLKPTWGSTYLIVTASHVLALVCPAQSPAGG